MTPYGFLIGCPDQLAERDAGGRHHGKLNGDVRQCEPAGRGHRHAGGPDPAGVERQHFQYDPEPFQLHHGADCWRDPGHRDDAGADPDDYRPQQPA